MKRIVFLTSILFVLLVSNGCSSGGDETVITNRITLVVDGITKTFYSITVDQTNPEFILVRGQIGSEVVETIELELFKNVTGTSAMNSMIFTQNNIEYYAFDGNGVYSNVTANGEDRKVRGNFEGVFRTLSGTNKLISNGSFRISY